MRLAFSILLASSLVGCLGSPSAHARPAPSCSDTAFRHASPAFCVELPAELRDEAPLSITNGVSFVGGKGGVLVEWAPRSDAARIAAWKSPAPRPDHQGTFEILKTEPMTGGTFFLVHDATQSKTLDIYKVPSLAGIAVVDGADVVLRCTARVNLDHDEDPQAIVRARAAYLETCKSLRVPPTR